MQTITDRIIERYSGVQDLLKEGCYVLSLCSIIEEYTANPVDILCVIAVAKLKKWVDDEGYVYNATALLSEFIGKKVTLKRMLPKEFAKHELLDEEYTIVKYKRNSVTHFRRRYVDTLKDSQTVKFGEIAEYYVFRIK